MKTKPEEKIFAQNKLKTVVLFAVALAFVALGIWMFVAVDSRPKMPSAFIKGTALTAIVFFGLAAVLIFIQFFDDKPALILNEKGIYNNTNFTANQTIPWNEIIEIETAQIKRSFILLVYVVEPNKYIQEKKGFKKILMQLNHKTYSTPLSITTQNIKCTFNELTADLQNWLEWAKDQREKA